MNISLGMSRFRVAALFLVIFVLAFTVAPSGAAGGSLQRCTTHCDCPQGEFCYKGTCLRDPKQAVYCCAKPGCPAGEWCMTPESTKDRCVEDPSYVCETACDCGPAHACMDVPDLIGQKTCVKDADDPWIPGGSIFGVEVPLDEPTYCCSDASCFAGQAAYGGSTEFACYYSVEGVIRDTCGGAPCYYSGDCGLGESCVDTRFGSTADPKTSCSLEGGFCISNAIAEAVFYWNPSDLVTACEDVSSPGLYMFSWLAAWRKICCPASDRIF